MFVELKSAVQCLYGRVKDDGLGAECECDVGVMPGSATCDVCIIGFHIWQTETNATCLPCGVGEVTAETNQQSCLPCEVSMISCLACPACYRPCYDSVMVVAVVRVSQFFVTVVTVADWDFHGY